MESSETWRTEALKSFAISKSRMQGAKDVRTGRPNTPSDGGGTWSVAGCPNDVARLAHFSKWSGQPIRIGYAIVRVWCSRMSCASPWGSPDRRARHMSSWGIRMELLRIATRGIAYSTRGGILSGRLSTFSGHFTSGIPSTDISHPDISQPDGRGGRFNFPGQTCPDPLIALIRRVFLSVYSAAEFLLKLPHISDRHLEIFCFRYLLSKSSNSPCNPPIIGFLSI